jgi:hypothetical protein
MHAMSDCTTYYAMAVSYAHKMFMTSTTAVTSAQAYNSKVKLTAVKCFIV